MYSCWINWEVYPDIFYIKQPCTKEVYLGVRLTPDLRWNIHITLLCSKAVCMLLFFFIQRKGNLVFLCPADFKLPLFLYGTLHMQNCINQSPPK